MTAATGADAGSTATHPRGGAGATRRGGVRVVTGLVTGSGHQIPPSAGAMVPSDVDVARGWPTGRVVVASGSEAAHGRTPLQALEDVVTEALVGGPCLVLFSGGRDSTVVLSAAVAAARRHGLPLPVAVTERYPGVHDADETGWQQAVVEALGLDEWVRLDGSEAADLLGPVATSSLQRLGLRWPPLAHTRGWVVRRALGLPASGSIEAGGRASAGGARSLVTVLDGEGGDELLMARRLAPMVRALGGHVGGRRGAGQLARGLAPRWLRRIDLARALRSASPAPWLRAEAAREFHADLVVDLVAEPLAWADSVRWWPTQRSVAWGMATLDEVTVAAGARPLHPLLHPAVVDAVADAGGRRGFADRAAASATLWPEHLPAGLLARTSKATFGRVVFGPHTRAFAEGWRGGGVEPALVDGERLAREWAAQSPSALSHLALQAAWLAET
jgi:hypothetical protein